jgi:hypothetical protein
MHHTFRSLILGALTIGLSLPSATRALEGRIGTYVAEGPGVLLEARQRLGKSDLGIHLAGSSIDLDVLKHVGPGLGANGSSTAPAKVSAQFLEAGLIFGRPLYTAKPWQLEANTGFGVGLLDGTMDEGLRPLAKTMLLVPLHLDATMHPFESTPRLGFLVGAGAVWTLPGDEDNLYPEVSSLRFQARAAVLF